MSGGIVIVLIIVVWLFILAPLLLRGQRPIRRAGRALEDTRLVHEGGAELPPDVGRRPRLRPGDARRARLAAVEDDDYEVVGAVAAEEPRGSVPVSVEVLEGDVVTEPPAGEDADADDESANPSAEEDPAGDYVDPGDMLYPEEDVEDVAAAAEEDAPDADAAGPVADAGAVSAGAGSAPVDAAEDDGETAAELSPEELEFAAARGRRGGWDPEAVERHSLSRYQRRRRTLAVLAVLVVATVAVALIVGGWAWWPCLAVVACTGLYLVALRNQVRQEQELRRRRIRQLRRARLGVRHRDDEELRIPRQLRRPGGIVVELDDESPDFAHLRRVRLHRDPGEEDAPGAAGEHWGRRAAG